jgi:drug/metabolite transporter (DMT)-like permease
MDHLVLTALYGLAAALCWGSGDFSGGLASRRASASSVVVAGYTLGFLMLAALAVITREPFPRPADLLWGSLAGIAGVLGLLAFYTALAQGKMGLAAPVSAVLTAALPVLFSAFTVGLPSVLQLGGFAIALVAITLISQPDPSSTAKSLHSRSIGLAMLAGFGFGCFFILISRVSPNTTFGSLAVARLASVVVLLALLLVRRQRIAFPLNLTPLLVLAGILDAAGNTFFVLAAHTGRLDVAAVLASLYPASTVLLAALLLRERVQRLQAVGIVLVLIAIPMISA